MKISRSIWFALILLGFSGQLAWAVENQFFNTFLYDQITPDPRPISWMVAITAVVAVVTTILMGTLSDRSRSRRWGKRRLFMLGGYIFWGIFTAIFPTAALFQPVALGVAIAILFDCIMSFWGSTANDAAFTAYVTDITSMENRGKVVGVLEILKWVALLITYGGAGFIVAAWGYFSFFYLIGGVVIVLGIIGGWLAKEPAANYPKSDGEQPKPAMTFWQQIASTFRWESLASNRVLLFVLLAVMLWNIAFNVFFPYLLIYLQHYIQLEGLQSSILVAVAILVGGILMGYPLGLLVDRWGRKPVALISVLAEFAGLLIFSFMHSFWGLLIAGILWVIPMAAWSIATSAWSKDLFPEENRGQFAGYEILFRVTFTMIPGPLLGGWLASAYGIPTVLDGKAGTIPTPLLFQVAALMTLLAAIPLFFAKESRVSSPRIE